MGHSSKEDLYDRTHDWCSGLEENQLKGTLSRDDKGGGAKVRTAVLNEYDKDGNLTTGERAGDLGWGPGGGTSEVGYDSRSTEVGDGRNK